MFFSKLPQNRHPERRARRSIANRGLHGAESKDPGDACWQMLLGAFRPQPTTEDKQSQPPSVPRFPTSPYSTATTYVVLRKENRMQLIEAASLDRKSGVADLSRPPPTALSLDNRPLPFNNPLLFVIPSEADLSRRAVEGSAVRHSERPTFAVLKPLFLFSSREPVVFRSFVFSTLSKTVILSEAPHVSVAYQKTS